MTLSHDIPKETLQQEEFIYDPTKQPHVEIVNGGAILMNFLKSIKPGADLVGALAPTFSLKPKSFLEWVAELLQPKDFLLKINRISSPEKRMLTVTKYLCEAMATMPQLGVHQVKGYNPVLGETFECSWRHKDSTTTFSAEQISHHPPVSACYMENKTCGIQIEIIFQPKVRFHTSLTGPSVNSHIEGCVIIHLPSLNEKYEITFPHFVCRNLLFGGSYCELNDELTITSSSGLRTVLSYKSKSKNKFSGKVQKNGSTLYKLEGVTDDRVILQAKDKSLLMSADNIKTSEMIVKPVAEQEQHESRRVWHSVTRSIFNKDLDKATKYKTLIEDAERTIRKERESRGEHWNPRLFQPVKKNGKPIVFGSNTTYHRHKNFNSFHESNDKAE